MIPKKLYHKGVRDFEIKIYNINKIVWHADKLCQLHHGASGKRRGVRLCCPALWTQEGAEHESNYIKTAAIVVMLRPVLKAVLENYVKGIGCKKEIYKTCKSCAMPILERDIKNKKEITVIDKLEIKNISMTKNGFEVEGNIIKSHKVKGE